VSAPQTPGPSYPRAGVPVLSWLLLCVALVCAACTSSPSTPVRTTPVAPSATTSNHASTVVERASSWPVPNRSLTPGAIVSACVPLHRPQPDRKTGQVTRTTVADHYGIATLPPGTELDHLIPFELCGSNGLANIWPELPDPRTGACAARGCVLNRKDQLEDRVYEFLRRGDMDLAHAVAVFANGDWRHAWCVLVAAPDVVCDL
jgi:hypothetical protein